MRSGPPLTILIADDHSVVREGLAAMVTRSGMRVVGNVETWTACVDAFKDVHPDVVLLDVNMPPANDGLAALPLILELDKNACVVVLSASADPAVVQQSIDLGARGFIAKLASPAEIESVIADAYVTETGSAVFDRRTATIMYSQQRNKNAAQESRALTDNELELLQILRNGSSVVELSKIRNISRSSANRSLTALYKKLGVATRNEAVVRADRLGLVRATGE